jgi:predicted acylesterase/phospholipase RssA
MNVPSRPHIWQFIAASCLVIGTLLGCTSIERLPAVPNALAPEAEILGIRSARFYLSDTEAIKSVADLAYRRRALAQSASGPLSFLAISGGGDEGAFGAGLLVGWSEKGDRPKFDVVTGVSTGSLSAPFAFLGREYDEALRAVYTETSAADVFESRPPILAAVANDAIFDSTPLRRMIERNLDDAVVKRIGEEYQKGRLLFVLTTNLDQGRPVIWNIGGIAASGNTKARDLIVSVLLASASIPAVFPPVMIDVTIGNSRYQEMHVDGGTIAQAFLYPPSFSLKRNANRSQIDKNVAVSARKPIAYIIRNSRQSRSEEDVKRQTLSIAKQAIATMTVSSGVNDVYRMYLTTRRDGVDFNLAAIGDDFKLPYRKPFDTEYMRALFAYGFDKGRLGYPWQKLPPGYAR